MKKNVLKLAIVLCVAVGMTSCYSVKATIGNGPQTGEKEVGHNHFLLGGLVPVGQANVSKMAAGAKDYQINTKFTFVDLLLSGITCGLYTPTTTVVKK